MTSTFLIAGPVAQEGDLASLYLRRDAALPVKLSTQVSAAEDEGYAEGMVTNTRFGSFPHSTIIGTPWGSQIRASKVDTGSRGRKEHHGKKRKAREINGSDQVENGEEAREAVADSTGFLHLLQPTPESWTYSLPHRTQVVYTPDYSYILHRIRARPGSTLIEAGSGSGSFTHAAARAVFDGYPNETNTNDAAGSESANHHGHVYSYEFHPDRHEKISQEMLSHNLSSIVTTTHRNVYKDGFLISPAADLPQVSPHANAIFLDLPAPWEALPHLTRTNNPSPLEPHSTIHICTFSPCIEQAQKTVSHLRRHNWLDIEVVEVSNHRIEIRREYTGFEYDGMRGVNAVARDVDQALAKLKDVEQRAQIFHATATSTDLNNGDGSKKSLPTIKSVRLANGQQEAPKVLYNEGKLVHRLEPELKTHTSYLVFAVLPREWTKADEERESQKWGKQVRVEAGAPKSQRMLKRDAKLKRRGKEEQNAGGGDGERSTKPVGKEERDNFT